MCGIIFIISKTKKNIIQYLLESLNIIQNRGYDSMGICYFDNNVNEYKIEKNASSLNNNCFNILNDKFISQNINSYIGLGHTRWATHGSKTDNNAHPHISEKGSIILVHNGIINNFDKIKDKLKITGINFYGSTDSEVIANLIEYYLLYMNDNIQDAIQNTINELEGTWALIIIYTKQLDTYYITRKGSPLVIGNNDNYFICSSETSGFIGLVYDYISLNDNAIVEVKNNEYKILNNKDNHIVKKVSLNDIIDTKNPYNHWMIKEIMEQPETIQKAYNYGGRIVENQIKLGGLDQIKNIINYIEHIIFIGCGTSFNASLLAEQYFNSNKKFISVKALNACEFNKNNLPNIENKSKILCVFLTQSGETIDVYNCLNICKNEGTLTMGIVNKVDSLIAREVMCGVYLNAGPEISVASTKSFTSMIIVISLIEMWFSQNLNINFLNNNIKINNLRYLTNTINHLIYDFNFINQVDTVKNFIINKNINNIFILGKNKLYPIACEGSLKIKEVCYIHCEAFSAGSLKHGPFALLDNTNLTLLLIDYKDKNNYENIKSTFHEISSRETNLFIITNSREVINELNLNDNQYILLYPLDYYNEILFVITLQYLAYQISVEKNIDPDHPRNLAKTVTVE